KIGSEPERLGALERSGVVALACPREFHPNPEPEVGDRPLPEATEARVGVQVDLVPADPWPRKRVGAVARTVPISVYGDIPRPGRTEGAGASRHGQAVVSGRVSRVGIDLRDEGSVPDHVDRADARSTVIRGRQPL